MFFVGLTFILIIFISGIVFLLKSSFIIGGSLVAAGIIIFTVFLESYRNKKGKDSLFKELDCVPDCIDIPDFHHLPDCHHTPDCDCSPDCSW
jgi:hypothetical protein